MTHRLASTAFLLLAFACGALPVHAQYMHPDIQSGKIVVHKLLILPAEVSVTKSGMKGNETLVDESQSVENALPDIIAAALQANGCTVEDKTLSADALQKDQELKASVANVQNLFGTLRPHVMEKPKDVRIGRYTIDDDVDNFAPGAAVDALVFTHGVGVVVTGGRKAFALAAGGLTTDVVGLDITVVDSQTGNVLFYTDTGTRGDFVGEPNRLAKPIEKSFKDFSCSRPPQKKK